MPPAMLFTLRSDKANASTGRFHTRGHQEHSLHDDEWINLNKKRGGAGGGQRINWKRRKGEAQWVRQREDLIWTVSKRFPAAKKPDQKEEQGSRVLCLSIVIRHR